MEKRVRQARAQYLDHFQTGIFAALDEKKEALLKEGKRVYNLSVGTPDFEPAPHIVKAFCEAGSDPKNYIYTLRDYEETLEAVKNYYKRRFCVDVETDQIVSVHGTQDGIGHIGLALVNEGDVVLLPNPGYPVFEAGAYIGRGECYFYELREKNGFLPVYSEISEEVARRTKYMVISYPYNPVCAVAGDDVYREAIEFAKKYDIIIVHDNAYSDIIFDGKEGKSFLSYPGAMDVGIEFLSLSKSFNVTGLRISFAVGRKDVIDSLKLLNSQVDFGMSIPAQKAAVAALTGPLDMVKEQCAEYEKRRNTLCRGLTQAGWKVPDTQGTMFAWAHIPEGYSTSEEFCMELMEKTGVIVTPGNAFGSLGEGYVRFALVLPPEKMKEVVEVIRTSGVLDK